MIALVVVIDIYIAQFSRQRSRQQLKQSEVPSCQIKHVLKHPVRK